MEILCRLEVVYEPLIVLEMLKGRNIQKVQRITGSALNVLVSSLFARAKSGSLERASYCLAKTPSGTRPLERTRGRVERTNF